MNEFKMKLCDEDLEEQRKLDAQEDREIDEDMLRDQVEELREL